MENSVFVEGFTVNNSPVADNSIPFTPNITPSTAPSSTPQIAAVEDKSIEVAASDLTVFPVTVNEATTEI